MMNIYFLPFFIYMLFLVGNFDEIIIFNKDLVNILS